MDVTPRTDAASRIYLDHAATSWPKLPSAVQAAFEFIQDCGATSGRGAYRSALQADQWLAKARLAVGRLLHAPDSNCIAFCTSGTHALNAAFCGLLRSGEHVVTTAIEHNSVLRPLAELVKSRGIDLSIAECDARGYVDTQAVAALLRPKTKWIVVGHASNVTGSVQAIASVSKLAQTHGAKLIVDASQTLGYIPIDVQTMGINVLAAAGHKGLRAIAGTGVLYVEPILQAELRPLMTGGTGSSSELIDVTPRWPQSVEVGNLNLPGIVSLAVASQQADTQQNWRSLYRELLDGLRAIPPVRVIESADEAIAIPVVSLSLDGWGIHDLAGVLDVNFGIEARAGLHCAALVHNFIGSAASGGTLRLSLGHGSRSEDVQATLMAFKEIAGNE